ncbi:DUF5686 and carboxypeptidase-like regulatory domain-containing protein [Aurantibacillus circumpalustris]|uniref:DUF5686 and carboxypeptidase-like regulatory domain-containing protein n=1 Tax=Aurantibacillus circumpalustris TaxID=3036359 RepID=UPI00295BBCF1|nr:DUF5686 family protein [Aurantibacillus circumpalustris]
MKVTKLVYTIALCVLFPLVQRAQYIISGKVFATSDKEALPFVSVIIKGTTIGAQTDFDGNFTINSPKMGDSLVAIYVGYKRLSRPLKKTERQTVNFPMESTGFSLDEVVINAGENPAHRIIRNCVKNKYRNDRSQLESYEYEVYNKLEFDLTRISKQMRDRKILKPIAFVFDNVDSTNSGEKPSLPFFIVENLSKFYHKSNPSRKKEIVIGSKITGIENSSISQVLGDMYQNINVYDNNILVFNKQFPSPLSENALFYYKFYLQDSAFENNQYIYHLSFKPKRVQELSFSGNIWIADTTWGVKRLEMSIPKDANINFINTANVIQEFNYRDSAWTMIKDRLVIDFAPTKKAMGFYGRKTASYKNVIFNQPKDDKFYEFADKIIVEEGATSRSDEFWTENRHDTLTAREKKIFKMIDTIQSLPIYKTWVDIFYILVAGHKKINNFEIGPYFNLVSYNAIEGLRLRFGGRTSNLFSKWYELSGYVAYGLKDEKLKYALGFKSFVSKKPSRQIIGMNYISDNEILGQSTNGFSQDNVLASFFRSSPLNNLTRVNSVQAYYEREWFPGLISRFSLIGRRFTTLGSNQYLFQKRDGGIGERESINNTEARINLRFAWKEKYVGEGFRRLSIGTRFPILQLYYSKSLQNAFRGEYDYHRLVVNVSDRIRITPILGYTDYVIGAGKIWGPVPYPLMELHSGNQTYIYDYMAFNMMRYYEFASDQFFSLAVYHHFEGIFLNKVPLLRKLKWREVITAKAVWGTVNNKNRRTLLFPNTLSALDKGPYVEASAGIENIFKIFRIDAFWRLSYQSPRAIENFGIKFGFQLTL